MSDTLSRDKIVAHILAGALVSAWELGVMPGPGDVNLETATCEMQNDGLVYRVTVEVLDPALSMNP